MQSYLQHFRGEFAKRVAVPSPSGISTSSTTDGKGTTSEVTGGSRVRTGRDEITPEAKRDTVLHGAPGVADVGMGDRT
jgi:hypothetical protein